MQNPAEKPKIPKNLHPIAEAGKNFSQMRRQYPVGSVRPPEVEEIEPERYHQCKNWAWFRNNETLQWHKRACNRCRDCRNFKHERIVGQSIAEANLCGVVMSMCLTYAPVCPLKAKEIHSVTGKIPFSLKKEEWPECLALAEAIETGQSEYSEYEPWSARRLDYDDVVKFCKRLRKAGYQFKKIACGEYGSDNGRAHWHLVLLFPWDMGTKERLIEAITNNLDVRSVEIPANWRELAPAHVANLRGEAFKTAIHDPDVLVVSYPQNRSKTAHILNHEWRFWPHGRVECQINKAPGYDHPEQLEGAIRYPLKYLSKDAWKDSKKFNQTRFEELPVHIQQQTKFGPWYTPDEIREKYSQDERAGQVDFRLPVKRYKEDWRRWRYGNQLVKDLEKELLEDYETDADVPNNRRLYKGQYHYKCKGGLGSDYFKALGHQVARLYPSDENVRAFEIGANYKKKQGATPGFDVVSEAGTHALLKHKFTGKIIRRARKRFKYLMGDTAYRHFWDGYNAELQGQGKPPTLGPDHVVEKLDTAKVRASDASSGSFGYHWWKNTTRNGRENIEEATSMVPDDRLAGLFPVRWRRQMETSSRFMRWRLKGLERMRREIEADIEKNTVALPELVQRFAAQLDWLSQEAFRDKAKLTKKQKKYVWDIIRPNRAFLNEVRSSVMRPELYEPIPPPPIETGEDWENRRKSPTPP